jgi:predicted nucleic acid-binding protein
LTMPVFVDTGGWFAYFVRRDADHMAAVDWMRQNRQPLVLRTCRKNLDF